MKKLAMTILAVAATLAASATDLKDLKIYINPGHGGHDSDDRNVAVPPFSSGDPEGFWESNSNLSKGLQMRDMLESFGAGTKMSRVTNTTEDDRGLTEIDTEANGYAPDFFFSIHSNATGSANRVNQPLMLYRGFNNDPVWPEAKVMSEILNKQLLENRVTSWSSENIWLAGDYDFYNWGVGVGLGVLRTLAVPGMLSEGSYHDYIPETYRLLNDDYCWLEAYHFVKSVMQYFNTSESFATGTVAGRVLDNRLIRTEAIYNNIFYGKDQAKPVCGATVELLDASGNVVESKTTDEYFNGVFIFKSVTPGNYTLRVSHSDYRAYQTDVTVAANTVTYINPEVTRIRNTAPQVEEYSPVYAEGDEPVSCVTPIRIKFNWDMDVASTEKAFSITPAVEGTISWEDSQYVLVFTPKRVYDINTVYTVKIDKSAMHPEGMSMTDDFSFSFTTADDNEFIILEGYPSNDARVHYASPYLEFRFDSHPNTSFIQEEITITDEAGNPLSYSARTKKTSTLNDEFGYFQMKLSSNLEPGKTYKVNVADNVRDYNNIPIAKGYSYKFTAVDASTEGAPFTLVESLDATSLLEKDADATRNATSTAVARNTSTKLEGTSSYKLDYTFSGASDGNAAFRFKTAPATTYSTAKSINLKVYGDMSANALRARFVNGADTRLVDICALNFIGWRDIAVPLTDGLGEGEYTLDGFEIAQCDKVFSKKGTVYLDKIQIGTAADGGIENIESASVRVHPNPASELLIANADKTILGIELISLDGKKVAAANGNVLNVSEVASGIYVAKIYTANGFGTKRVAIRH
ncbi:MAG: Ig-like domain-containing protein [Bacteroidales bacterium]|nr:Ig-like domain-containing protein [Bacteroidales bacterium]